MAVLAFPARHLTRDDQSAIIAKAGRGGYCCQPTIGDDGCPSIVLLDDRRRVRGYITKEHGVYAVMNARRIAVVESRRLDDVLSVLSP
jgi:hypothetical protein